MKKHFLLLLLCLAWSVVCAQTVSRNYRNKSMSDVLIDLSRSTKRYKITFIYNELEDFRVTKHFEQLTIPDAIRECIGFYPIAFSQTGDSLLFVECTQKTAQRVIGRITDENKHPIKAANIVLFQSADSTIVNTGISNEDGRFVVPTTEERFRMRISCIGYETLEYHCHAGDIGTLTLHEATNRLEEVVVEAMQHRMELERDIYLPTRQQRDAADDGIGLLANLMIPHIHIDPSNKQVRSNNGRSLTLRIDGRQVGQDELEQIRPIDVLRVEYLDHPTAQFSNDESTLNILLRQYDYGGYVHAKSQTVFLYSWGDYRVQTNLNHRKMSYTFLAGSTFSNLRQQQEEKEEDFLTSLRFHKHSETDYDHERQTDHYGLLRANYHSEHMQAVGWASLRWSQTPRFTSTSLLDYTGGVSGTTTAYTDNSERRLTPTLGIWSNVTLSPSQQLTVSAQLGLGHTNYQRDYQENTNFKNISKVRENRIDAYLSLYYTHQLKHQNSLTCFVYEHYHRYNDYYTGSAVSDQQLWSSELLVFPQYHQQLGRSFSFMLRPLGFSIEHWATRNHRQHYLSSRAAANAKWQICRQHNLSWALFVGNSYPQPSSTSELEQVQNRYVVLRGNPELGKTIFFTNYIDHNMTTGNWQLLTHAQHEAHYHIVFRDYYPEGEQLISSFTNAGNYHTLRFSLSPVVHLLNRQLQLQGTLALERQITTGPYSHTNNTCYANLNARYYAGAFSLSAYYESPSTVLYTSNYLKSCHNYGLCASYRHKGLYAEAGVKNLFNHNAYSYQYFDTPYYTFSLYKHHDGFNARFYVNLSYSFDFGRRIEHQDVNVESSGSSAILR